MFFRVRRIQNVRFQEVVECAQESECSRASRNFQIVFTLISVFSSVLQKFPSDLKLLKIIIFCWQSFWNSTPCRLSAVIYQSKICMYSAAHPRFWEVISVGFIGTILRGHQCRIHRYVFLINILGFQINFFNNNFLFQIFLIITSLVEMIAKFFQPYREILPLDWLTQ